MNGYRQSNFDPDAFAQPGAPLRPYNWVQWSGVAVATIGIGINLVYLAGVVGWIAPRLSGTSPAILLLILGMLMIHSRREPASLVGDEQLRKNRRVLLVTAAICAVILGLATAIEFTGAN